MRSWMQLFTLCMGSYLLLGAFCLPRPCNDETNCLRVCDCTDAQRDLTFQCPIFFQCNVESGYCESDYGMSCTELCETFGAANACGSKRCDNESDCNRFITCDVSDPNTGAVISSFDCESAFACEGSGVCEAGFTVDDTTLCQECAFSP